MQAIVRRSLIVLASAASLSAVLPAVTADAATVTCGSTITTNVVLTRNLNCAGDALIVGASGLTINLNGKKITGNGTGTAIAVPQGDPGSTVGLTVRNGTIEHFGFGVDDESDGTLVLSGMAVRNDTVGLASLAIGLRVTVSASSFSADGRAIGSPRPFGFQPTLTVSNSMFAANTVAIDALSNSRLLSVSRSIFFGNRVGLQAHNGTVSVTNSWFVHNRNSITASEDGLTVTGNTIADSEIGLRITDDYYGMTVSGNRISGTGIGIQLDGVNGNPGGAMPTVNHNVLSNNRSAGLYVNLIAGGVDISANTVQHNGSAPGSFTDPAGNPLTAGIWANRSTITGNTANYNAGYGIEAYAVTDGGSNVARGNGNPAQCLGVVCTRTAPVTH